MSTMQPTPETGTPLPPLPLGLDALAPQLRRASCHPLVPLPTPEVGAARLRSGVTFAVAGDPAARHLALALAGRPVEVDDADRTAYHAAAAIAANHVVALLGQVERVAATAGLPLDAFAGLIRAATDDALALGPAAALTGPGCTSCRYSMMIDVSATSRSQSTSSSSSKATCRWCFWPTTHGTGCFPAVTYPPART